jgi:hypothetical protein
MSVISEEDKSQYPSVPPGPPGPGMGRWKGAGPSVARLTITRFVMSLAMSALVVVAPVADPAAFAAPTCCSLRLDSLPAFLVAGGSPAIFSGAIVNEASDHPLVHTVLVLTVKLNGLTPERLRIERETVDAQWLTLPIDAAGAGLVKAFDTTYENVDIAPGGVAGGRYRMVFAVTAPTGSASVTMEAYPSDNRTAGGLLGRSSTYPLAVRPPAPPAPSGTVAPPDAVSESRTGGLGDAADPSAPDGGPLSSGLTTSSTAEAPVGEQVAAATSQPPAPRLVNRWTSIWLGGLAILVLLVGVGWWIARRRARW